MKRLLSPFIAALVVLVASATASAQSAGTAAATDNTAPSYDMKAQALADLQIVQNKMVALVNAVPADKLTWRPSPDSRSFAEVFLHVAGERYQILGLGGAVPPADFNGKTYEKSTTDKAQIVAELNRTWDFAQKTIKAMSNADFAKPVPKLGPDANAGDVVYILVADAHEHLGQLVAYARVNGIVPPWTAEAQKKAAEKKAEEKKPQ